MKLNYDLLNCTVEQLEQIMGLIENKINPKLYTSVQKWSTQWYNEPNHDELVMCAINEILQGYGVEAIEGEWQNGYWGNIVATYVNMGDTSIPTVILHRDNGYMVGCWGDLVENI